MAENKNPELDLLDFDDDVVNLAPLKSEDPVEKVGEEKKESELAARPSDAATGSGGPDISPVET
jgi:hypothetical protein